MSSIAKRSTPRLFTITQPVVFCLGNLKRNWSKIHQHYYNIAMHATKFELTSVLSAIPASCVFHRTAAASWIDRRDTTSTSYLQQQIKTERYCRCYKPATSVILNGFLS